MLFGLSTTMRRVCAGVAMAAAAAAPAGAETLADALILAYRNSNLLEQNRALLRAADEDVASAVAATRPAINFVLQTQYELSKLEQQQITQPRPVLYTTTNRSTLSASVSLTGEITLFDFGRNRAAIAAAKESVLATRQALVDVEQRVLLNAVQAYMNMIRATEIVALRQNNVRLITQELRAARDRFEVGEVTRTDVSLAEARLAAARAELAAAQGDLETARETYNVAVGQYPGALSRPPAPPMTARTESEAKAVAQRRHPQILQAQHEVQVAELNIARAEAAMKPRLTGQLGVTLGANDQQQRVLRNGASTSTGTIGSTISSSAGIQLSAPIYQGGALSAALRKAMAQRDASRSSLLQTTLTVGQNVGNAWAQVSVAQARLQASQRQVRAAQVAYEGFREEARLGARTTLDVLNAEQELLDARANRITAEIDQYVAIYTLLSAMGLLTVDHLDLGVVTYDPADYYNAVKDAPLREVSPQGERLDSVLRRLGKD